MRNRPVRQMKNSQYNMTIGEIVGLIGRDLLLYMLAIGVALQLPTSALAAQTGQVRTIANATNGSASDANLTGFAELTALVQEIHSNQNAADIDAKRSRASELAMKLNSSLQPDILRLQAEIEPLRSQVFRGTTPEIEDRFATLHRELGDKLKRQELIRNLMGPEGMKVMAGMLIDPKGAVSEKNTAKVELSMPSSQGALNAEESPLFAKSAIGRWASTGYKGAIHFRNEYAVFSVAMGFISLAQTNWSPTTNPNALEMWEKQTIDLVGVAGFGIFMLANHKVIHLLQSVRQGRLPPSLMMYIGMSAGSVASTMFHEMWMDKDIWQCVRPKYDSRAKAVDGACERAFRTWFDSKKIMQYAPTIMSLIASTALAQVLRDTLVRSGGPQALKQGYMKAVIRGGRVFKSGGVARKGLYTLATGVPGIFVKVGDFTIFLAMDIYVTAEPSKQAWDELKSNWWDPVAFARNKLTLHSEFLLPLKGSLQPIANAFDVEAASPYAAHKYLMEFYKKMQDTNWARPAPVESCLPENIKKLAKAGKKYEDDSWTSWLIKVVSFRTDNRVKSSQQLSCEVFARPDELVARYGEMNREWRTTLLGHFTTAQQNWLTMIAQFNQVYTASWNMARYMANGKLRSSKGLDPKPDLSREALAKAISSELKKDGEDPYQPGHAEQGHGWYLDGTWLPTPELVDYVAAGFACGPERTSSPSRSGGFMLSRAWDNLYSFFAKQMSSPSYLATPYGSSLRFVPPRLTNSGRDVCANVDRDILKNIRYVIGDSYPAHLVKQVLPEKMNSKASVVVNPFTGPFTDRDGKQYATLAEYAFENLDPELWQSQGNYANIGTWWDKYFVQPIKPVWENYRLVYEDFTRQSYIPVLFNRDYRHGCKPVVKVATLNGKSVKIPQVIQNGKTDSDGFAATTTQGKGLETGKEIECQEESGAYRVAEGVFLGLEIELRNYLRGLYSLYTSTYSEGPDKETAKKAFLTLANGMIDDIKTMTPDDIKAKDFESRLESADEKAKSLIETVETRLKTLPDNAFRLEMLTKFKDQIAKLTTEQKDHAMQFHKLELTDEGKMGAPGRAPVENLNNRSSSNPLRRHGG